MCNSLRCSCDPCATPNAPVPVRGSWWAALLWLTRLLMQVLLALPRPAEDALSAALCGASRGLAPAFAASRTLLDTALTALLVAVLPGPESPAVAYRCVRCSVPAGDGTGESRNTAHARNVCGRC